ncbi:hypothetical protein [Kalamiella sp. sgz302252]|uniref:hypothetical protein n=1 Tax=Pantoea sp. sgz302252 TaxID=3341827 RepID=UPI0036D2C771
MRELTGSETSVVAAAGVITDDPQIEVVLDVYDNVCDAIDKAEPTLGAGNANKAVHFAVNIMDYAWTSAFNSIMKLFG